MKGGVILRLVLAGATLGCLSGVIRGEAAGREPARKEKEAKETQIVVSGDSLLLNGQSVTLPMPVRQFIALLDKPSRESRLANTILTWDDLGIYAYVDPKSEKLHSVRIEFRKEPYDFAPARTFAGKITMDHTDLTADTTIESLNAAKKGKAFEKSLPGLWSREQGNVVLFLATPRDGKQGIVYLSIEARATPGGSASASAKSAATAKFDAGRPATAGEDALDQLGGNWSLDGFLVSVIGGEMNMVGVGGSSGHTCGDVSVARSDDRTMSFTASCEADGDYFFRLTHGSEPGSYLVTVKSKHGISIVDLPVTYVEGQGWQGARNQIVGGDSVSVTATINPIEGRNWRGWRIQVLPPAAVSKDAKPEDLKEPYFMADPTRRK